MDVQELGNESKNTVEHGQENNPPNDSGRKKAIDRYKDPKKRQQYKQEWAKKNYHKVAEQRRAYSTEYYHANRERVLKQKAERMKRDPDGVRASWRSVRKSKPEYHKLRLRAWKEKNAAHVEQQRIAYLARRRKLSKLRRAQNPTRKLAENCRSRICHILKREKVTKSQSTFKFIGCTAEFFREFLEHQFTEGMNWLNYGVFWNVDHVIPISKFHLHNPDHLRMAFHYSNCRPLKAEENSEKNDTLPAAHQPFLI